MKEQEAIDYLDNLQVGEFITVNIPVFSGEYIASTCLYMGKDDEGRYILKDESCFKLSKDFLIKNKMSYKLLNIVLDNSLKKKHTLFLMKYCL